MIVAERLVLVEHVLVREPAMITCAAVRMLLAARPQMAVVRVTVRALAMTWTVENVLTGIVAQVTVSFRQRAFYAVLLQQNIVVLAQPADQMSNSAHYHITVLVIHPPVMVIPTASGRPLIAEAMNFV